MGAALGPDRLVLGVDVGGTKIAVGAVDGAAARGVVEHPTVLASSDALLDGLEHTVRQVTRKLGAPAAIGVGVPSQIEFATGRVMSSVNIPLEGVPLREELSERLGCPVFVDNDANCAALAEAQLVDDGPARHLVMLTLGTGVGGGAIVDGRVVRGADGMGAELGHMSIDPNGPACVGNCPNTGCLEAYCSGTALERDATQFGRDLPETELGRVLERDGSVSAREVVRLAQEGDRYALRLIDRFASALGVGIASYVNIFQPTEFVLGGGLSRAAAVFLDRALGEASARALPRLWQRTTVSLARGGADAGVIGAGVLAARELGASPP
jgi:glucokinase